MEIIIGYLLAIGLIIALATIAFLRAKNEVKRDQRTK